MKGLLGVIQPPGVEAFGELATPAIWGTIIAFAIIASAESLFSAAAVDRLHDGPRTEYNKEMIAPQWWPPRWWGAPRRTAGRCCPRYAARTARRGGRP